MPAFDFVHHRRFTVLLMLSFFRLSSGATICSADRNKRFAQPGPVGREQPEVRLVPVQGRRVQGGHRCVRGGRARPARGLLRRLDDEQRYQ